jgi:hypothetical protein
MNKITLSEMYALARHVKKQICDDYRIDRDDDNPGIQLTVGANDELTQWSYQTGDNSFTGGAYSFPNWAVVGVYRDSNCREIAREIIDQLEELTWDKGA